MSTEQTDIYEENLDKMIIEVNECQEKQALHTCSKCEKYIGCELRSRYIMAVYDSMSKGQTGGFEF
ncbi:hypothetical protein [Sulfurimonas sp. HSL-1716]|uniref:hypothetical protein n=1 Tax=Hydrocurvibacter sulfurireducens TaxID=3131937 RepID=UPI0031F9CABF